MSHRQVKMHVKVTLVALSFARLTEMLFWSVLCLMAVDAAKKESLEFTEKLTFIRIGSKQVNHKEFQAQFYLLFQYLLNLLLLLLRIQFHHIIRLNLIF